MDYEFGIIEFCVVFPKYDFVFTFKKIDAQCTADSEVRVLPNPSLLVIHHKAQAHSR